MAALLAGGVVVGGILAGNLTASATDTPSPTATGTTQAPSNPNPGDPSQPQRSDEILLTGATASKVKAAVLAKYPGAALVRVETDSDGVYEAHITNADGTSTIVQLNKSYAITGEDQGGGHDGDADDDAASGTT